MVDTHRYKIHSKIPYILKNKKVYFELVGKTDIQHQLKRFNRKNWIKYDVERKSKFTVGHTSGIYAFVISDRIKNVNGIAYIGGSKNLTFRFLSHETLHFLKHGISINYNIEVYILPLELKDVNGEERRAINKFKPFLNKEKYQDVYITYKKLNKFDVCQ